MIPKSFQLLGYTWQVVLTPSLMSPDSPSEHLYGYCDFSHHTIYISSDLPTTDQWHTFLHELLHATLEAIGRPKLSKDEGFVDALSGAMAQALLTGKARVPRRAASSSRKK